MKKIIEFNRGNIGTCPLNKAHGPWMCKKSKVQKVRDIYQDTTNCHFLVPFIQEFLQEIYEAVICIFYLFYKQKYYKEPQCPSKCDLFQNVSESETYSAYHD